MIFSIITINYNNLSGLEKTIQSVLNQTLENFEYIVIDGGSTDGSKEYIQEKNEFIDYWVSETDNGIYHAMNKGIEVAKGEYCLFLNSGDELYNRFVLEKVKIELYNEDIITFDLIYRGASDINSNFPENLNLKYLWTSNLGHPSTFINIKLFKELKYDENFKVVSDWKFFLCSYINLKATYRKVNQIISVHYLDGISSDPKNKDLISLERDLVLSQEFKWIYSEMCELNRALSTLNLLRLSRIIKFLQWFKLITKF
jgi:glycosyltransferase involved in cell wall biosynthesis